MVSLSPQQLEIYLLLKQNLGRETSVSEFVQRDGLNIASYTERISELRKKGFNVVSTQKNFYVLRGEPTPDLNFLRTVYVEAEKRGYHELMARCVTKAKELKFLEDVKSSLF